MSKSRNEHLVGVNEVFKALQNAYAKAKLRKIALVKAKVTYLAMELSRDGWKISVK